MRLENPFVFHGPFAEAPPGAGPHEDGALSQDVERCLGDEKERQGLGGREELEFFFFFFFSVVHFEGISSFYFFKT